MSNPLIILLGLVVYGFPLYVFIKALFALFTGTTYRFNAVDGLVTWNRKRLDRNGTFVVACISGVVFITLIFAGVMLARSPTDRAMDRALAPVKQLLEDREQFTLLYHQCDSFVSRERLAREHMEVVQAVKERIPAALPARLLKQGNKLLGAIEVRLPESPPSPEADFCQPSSPDITYWHVSKHLGSQTASEAIRTRGGSDHPPDGFITFKARYGKYVVHGLATTSAAGQLREVLAPDEFVLFSAR